MKKLLYLLLFVTTGTIAQELDSLVSDTVEIELPKNKIGGYLLIGADITPNPGGTALMRRTGAGIRYNKWDVSFAFSGFMGEHQERLIFPNYFDLIYAHGGINVSYKLKSISIAEFAAFSSYQAGDMIWERSDTKEDFLRETFNLLQFGLETEISSLRYLRPTIRLGYQSLTKLELSGLDKETFTGVFVGFTVKVGYFNQ